jgi:hypothetical protein
VRSELLFCRLFAFRARMSGSLAFPADAVLRQCLCGVRFETAHVRTEGERARSESQARIALRTRSKALRMEAQALRRMWKALGTFAPALRIQRAPLRAQ